MGQGVNGLFEWQFEGNLGPQAPDCLTYEGSRGGVKVGCFTISYSKILSTKGHISLGQFIDEQNQPFQPSEISLPLYH